MPPRAYVLIFAFWALLTVITPTLISWSASAKPNLATPSQTSLEMKVNRRMIGFADAGLLMSENGTMKRRSPGSVGLPAPSPAPVPAPAAGHEARSASLDIFSLPSI